jgi:hypothetical protein
MTKDELINQYLYAFSTQSGLIYGRKNLIAWESFEKAMQFEFEIHFWQDTIKELEDELLKKDWYCDAVLERWLL